MKNPEADDALILPPLPLSITASKKGFQVTPGNRNHTKGQLTVLILILASTTACLCAWERQFAQQHCLQHTCMRWHFILVAGA